MATRTAGKAGNWNDPTVWSGGAFPIAGDTAELGGFDIVQNVDITCATIQNTAGGTLMPSSSAARVINANIINVAENVILFVTNGGPVTINGNVTNSAIAGNGELTAAVEATDGLVTINGNVLNSGNSTPDPRSATGAFGVACAFNTTINGTVTNTGTNGAGVLYAGQNVTLTISGNCINGTNGNTSVGVGGSPIVTATGVGVSSNLVDISGDVINYAAGGWPIITGSANGTTPNGNGGYVYLVRGNWLNNAGSGLTTGSIQGESENLIVVLGDVHSASASDPTYRAISLADNASCAVVGGKIYGPIYFSGATLVSRFDSPQGNITNDNGYWICYGNPQSAHNWTAVNADAFRFTLSIMGNTTKLFVLDPTTNGPILSLPTLSALNGIGPWPATAKGVGPWPITPSGLGPYPVY